MCRLINQGGLGVESIEDFKLALLYKWKCRLLVEKMSILVDMLKATYENLTQQALAGKIHFNHGQRSFIPFWTAIWSGNISLNLLYPDLYQVSNKKKESVEGIRRSGRYYGLKFGLDLIASDRLPSKDQPGRRGVISSTHDLTCVLCFQEEKQLKHFFFQSLVVKRMAGSGGAAQDILE
ncbi:hypothetical protein KIW84_050368 [Lathyrus oleraceus]|uniref:Uncharacterized protein n=1 Tax=Pisum sativum TaxID=3888 RepID=A0A9D4WJL4_PEA|nr:hypothetical protein KIW84_050368 [Pisum sativum]